MEFWTPKNDMKHKVRIITTKPANENPFYKFYNRAYDQYDTLRWTPKKKIQCVVEAARKAIAVTERDVIRALVDKLLSRTDHLVDA